MRRRQATKLMCTNCTNKIITMNLNTNMYLNGDMLWSEYQYKRLQVFTRCDARDYIKRDY